MEQYKKYLIHIILILLILSLSYLLYKLYHIPLDTFTNINKRKLGIATTVKNPHQLNDWIRYHLNIGFSKLYIVFYYENEIFVNNYVNDNNVNIFVNNTNWKNELTQLPNMEQYINEKKEVMSRQILNFTNVRNYAQKDGVEWLLHIDADELFYPESSNVNAIFNNAYDVITFQNFEMIPNRDNYDNCFKDGISFKTNSSIFKASLHVSLRKRFRLNVLLCEFVVTFDILFVIVFSLENSINDF